MTTADQTTSSSPVLSEADLLERHKKLVFLATKKYRRISPAFEDDILQVGRLALLKAIRQYQVIDATKRAAFTTCAMRKIQWDVYAFINGRSPVGDPGQYGIGFDSPKTRATVGIDEPVGADKHGDPFTHRDVVDAEAAKDEASAGHAEELRLKQICDLREALEVLGRRPMRRRDFKLLPKGERPKRLTVSERRIVRNFLITGSASETARRLRISQVRAAKAIRSVVEKLRRYLTAHSVTTTPLSRP